MQKGEEKVEEHVVDSAEPVEGSCNLRSNAGSWFPTAVEDMSTGQADEHLDAGKQNADAEITEKLDDESDLDGKKFLSERQVQRVSNVETMRIEVEVVQSTIGEFLKNDEQNEDRKNMEQYNESEFGGKKTLV